MNFQELIKQKEYRFLYDDPHLGKNLLFVCIYGSYAYGTNRPESDIDIRGVALDNVSSLIGLDNFEQYQDKETDTVIYSFSKFVRLARQNNPNIIELLFLEKEHYLYISPLGQILLDNRHIFLCRRSYYTFRGYANEQRNRLENALARNEDISTKRDKIEHINRSVDNVLTAYKIKNHLGEDSIKSRVNDNLDIVLDIEVKGLSYQDFKGLNAELANTINSYQVVKENKPAPKDDKHLNKHMMHLVRLYLEGTEILEKSDFHVYQKEHVGLLNDIRDGKYRREDGQLSDEFITLLNDLEKKFQIASSNSKLPKEADNEKINELVDLIYRKGLFHED